MIIQFIFLLFHVKVHVIWKTVQQSVSTLAPGLSLEQFRVLELRKKTGFFTVQFTSHESQIIERAMRWGLRVRGYLIRLEGLTIYWCETKEASFSQLFEVPEWSIETTTTTIITITITLFTHGKKQLNWVDLTGRRCFLEFKIPNFVNWSCNSSLEKIINKFPLITLGRIYCANASGVKNPSQLAIYKRGRGFELRITVNKSSWRWGRDLNSRPPTPNCKSSALPARPHCLVNLGFLPVSAMSVLKVAGQSVGSRINCGSSYWNILLPFTVDWVWNVTLPMVYDFSQLQHSEVNFFWHC